MYFRQDNIIIYLLTQVCVHIMIDNSMCDMPITSYMYTGIMYCLSVNTLLQGTCIRCGQFISNQETNIQGQCAHNIYVLDQVTYDKHSNYMGIKYGLAIIKTGIEVYNDSITYR